MMKTNFDLVEDVKKGPILSAYVQAHFDQGLELLQEKDYNLISLKENAQLRIQEGYNTFISRNGNWVLPDVAYIPQRKPILTNISHITKNPKHAANAHRSGVEFYLTDEQVEECLTDFVELDEKLIPTNRFGDNKITQYAFCEHSQEYGRVLREYGIKEMPIWLVNTQDRPFARKLWFGGLGYGDRSVGNNRGLVDSGVRGVRQNVGEAGTQKISRDEQDKSSLASYTLEDIQKVLRSKGLSDLEKTVVQGLKELKHDK